MGHKGLDRSCLDHYGLASHGPGSSLCLSLPTAPAPQNGHGPGRAEKGESWGQVLVFGASKDLDSLLTWSLFLSQVLEGV
jgi:hypothetical protein